MIRSHRIAVFSVAGLVTSITLSGCGLVDSITGSGGPKATLIVKQNAQFGSMVTDGKGHTLYRYDLDKARPPRSNCVGECSANWIPVLAPANPTVIGINPQLVGVVRRPEGTMQMTLAGWPLYTFIQDRKSGQFHGEGIASTWWMATPEGRKIQTGAQTGSQPQGQSNQQGQGNQGGTAGDGSAPDPITGAVPSNGSNGSSNGSGAGSGSGGGGGY